jgi:hypothetical protein
MPSIILSAGTYSLTVNASNGCTKTGSLQRNAISTVNYNHRLPECKLLRRIQWFCYSNCYRWCRKTIIISGPLVLPPLQLIIYHPACTPFQSQIITGVLMVTPVTITEPPLLVIAISPQNVSCFGASNGSATASPAGGSPAYNYSWSNGSSTSTINNLNPGTYSVTVTDSHACTKTSSVVYHTAFSTCIYINRK